MYHDPFSDTNAYMWYPQNSKLILEHLFTELFREDFFSVIKTNTACLFNNPYTLYVHSGEYRTVS